MYTSCDAVSAVAVPVARRRPCPVWAATGTGPWVRLETGHGTRLSRGPSAAPLTPSQVHTSRQTADASRHTRYLSQQQHPQRSTRGTRHVFGVTLSTCDAETLTTLHARSDAREPRWRWLMGDAGSHAQCKSKCMSSATRHVSIGLHSPCARPRAQPSHLAPTPNAQGCGRIRRH